MPALNGTGPAGMGPLTGRGLGYCTGARSTTYRYGRRPGFGLGYGRGMGLGRRFAGRGMGSGMGYGRYYGPVETVAPEIRSDKEFLVAQRDALKDQLEIINSQLEDLAEDSK